MDYFLHIAIVIGIFIILSVSLDLMAGYTGMLSLAHAAFFGVGAYSYALLATRVHVNFLTATFFAMMISSLLGALIGYPSLRIRLDYFAITTLALQVVLVSVFNNLVSVTGGPMGFTDIAQASVGNWVVTTKAGYLVLTGATALMVIAVSWLIVSGSTGRVLRAIREDEVFTESLGINVASYKIVITAISASLASLAGCVYAAYFSFIDPSSFSLSESIFIISIVIVGGAGSISGPVVGACVLVSLPEALRFLGLPSAVAANLRQIIYGLLLIVLMLWRPRGFRGTFGFGSRIQ